MNQTNYRTRPVRAPIQPHPAPLARKQAYNVREEKNPVMEEVRKLCGTYSLSATFEEDTQTLGACKHIPGLVAVLCTLKKDGRVIALGRGSSCHNRMNRSIERTTFAAINGSLMSAVNNCTKVIFNVLERVHGNNSVKFMLFELIHFFSIAL